MRNQRQVLESVEKVLIGKGDVIRRVYMTILAKGHILLEDIPGVGKTTLALAFSKALSLEYGRVQFTPDVLPSDITGFSIYEKESGKMIYQKGAVLCNLFLADELNRATSRTQSALLEAMEEGQVTVDGVSYPLPSPFTVIATQNPVGAAGTQLLPDSQMDRFMVRLSIGYPDAAAEEEMIRSREMGNPLHYMEPSMTSGELAELQNTVAATHMDGSIRAYIVELIAATRKHPALLRGASPRATLAVASMARAAAFLAGRDFVVPEDVQSIFFDTVAHRLLPADERKRDLNSLQLIVSEVLQEVAPPTI